MNMISKIGKPEKSILNNWKFMNGKTQNWKKKQYTWDSRAETHGKHF